MSANVRVLLIAWCIAGMWAISAVGGFGAGQASIQLRLVDLAGRQIDPLAPSEPRATVFIFTRTDCPISNRYAPEIQRIYREFDSRVTFWLVFVDSDQSADVIRRYLREFHYSIGALRDLQHDLVHQTGVQVTPEVAVFVPSASRARMVYRGRIDDRYADFGASRLQPTQHNLEQVLRAIVEGRPTDFATTRAVGCFISDLEPK